MKRNQLPGLFGMAPGLFNQADKNIIRSLELYRTAGGAHSATVATSLRNRSHLQAVLTAYNQFISKVCGKTFNVNILVFPEEEKKPAPRPCHPALSYTQPSVRAARSAALRRVAASAAGRGADAFADGSLRAPPAAR